MSDMPMEIYAHIGHYARPNELHLIDESHPEAVTYHHDDKYRALEAEVERLRIDQKMLQDILARFDLVEKQITAKEKYDLSAASRMAARDLNGFFEALKSSSKKQKEKSDD